MSDLTANRDDQLETPASDLTRRDRFSGVLVVLVTTVALAAGLLIRQRAASDVWSYVNQQAGIDASYPAGWLVDEQGNYTARIRDPRARPFKTQYMITIVPAGGQTSVRNVLDNLTLQRSNDLPAYRVLNVGEVASGGTTYTRMDFAYVESDPNPFIQRLPTVVQGLDVVILDGNRAIVVTFLSAQGEFEDNLPAFERFLATLRY